MSRVLALLLVCLLSSTSAMALEILVRPDGTGDVATIADAIALAGRDDVIVLADGVFTGPGNRDFDLPGRDVHLRSASADADACVIDLQSHGGFFQEAAFRVYLDNLTVSHGHRADGGGVLHAVRGTLTARGCRFLANAGAEYGAVIFCQAPSEALLLEDCEVAFSIGDMIPVVAVNGGSVTLRRCDFHDHRGQLTAVFRINGGARIEDCVFRDNVIRGTALFGDWANLEVIRTLFIDNESQFGGAASLDGSSAAFRNCTFLRNTAPTTSDITFAFAGYGDNLIVERCLFAYGRATFPVFAEPADAVQITCTNMYTAGGGWHATIAGQLGQAGNLDVDPMICDLTGGVLTVADISPCLPQNNPCHELIGLYGQGCAGEGYLVRPDGSGVLADIQTAIDVVPAGGTVLLADGVFAGPGNADLDFRGKALTLRSLSGDPAACVIEGGGAARAVRFHTGEDATSIVQNVTLRGGQQAQFGGVVLVDGASPSFVDCRFENGHAFLGGGLAVTGDSWPVLRHCVFVGNTADVGGAVYVQGAHADFYSCTIAGNHSPVGACFVQEGVLRLEQSIIAHNTGGPALLLHDAGQAHLTACDLFGNEGGDWTAPIADQLNLRDNFLAPPCFCDLDGGLVTLCADSWCLPVHNPLGNGLLVGALGSGCDDCGCSGPVETEEGGTPTVPPLTGLALTAHPNPFNPATTITYSIDLAGPANLAVFDLRGRRVATLLHDSLPVGEGHVDWNGSDDAGRALEAGAYVCRLETATSVRTVTILLVK